MVSDRTIFDIIMESLDHRTPGGAARLEALTKTALDMFLDQGFEAVSLDDLIARVGGSRRNIYQHFGGKEGLFIAAVSAVCDELTAPIKSLKIPLSGDPAAALWMFGKAVLERVLLPRTLDMTRLMIAEAVRFPDVAQTLWRSGHEQPALVLAEWIAHQQKSGVLRKGPPPPLLARQFVDLVVTDAQFRALIGVPCAFKHDKALRVAIETFLQGQASGRIQSGAHRK
jgi:AcrR family transcriptional regulator